MQATIYRIIRNYSHILLQGDFMDYENISQLISSNVEATQYFNSLSAEMQQKILDRGTGVNTLDKLKEFKNLVENNGLKLAKTATVLSIRLPTNCPERAKYYF